MSNLTVVPLPIFADNYIWIIHDENNKSAICIDPGLADPVIDYLKENQLSLEAILITHHHPDHIGGLDKLSQTFPVCQIITPKEPRIPHSKEAVSQDQKLTFNTGKLTFTVIETPGHTRSHICFYSENNKKPILFSGDTLFSGGCGRLFEGTPKEMLHSLNKLKALPQNTLIYCTHEYTLSNLKFYQSISQQNKALNQIIEKLLLEKPINSLPTRLSLELEINPFLRANSTELKALLKEELDSLDELSIFTHIRQLKDNF